jgi:hypothetical protein
MYILFLIVIIVIAIIIIRAISSAMSGPRQWPPAQQPWPQAPPGPGASGMPFQIESAADGFWIHPIGYPVGSVIHYRYHTFGAPQQSTALVETGGRQFIYTGDTPSDILVTHITPPTGIPESQTNWPWPQQPTGPGAPGTATEYPTARPVPPEEDTSVSGGDFGGEEGPSRGAPAEEAPSAPAGGYPSAY